jgi:O-antigen ligase
MWILNKYRLFELIVGSIISLSILLFLTVRGATNIAVILLSLMGLFSFIKGIPKNKSIISNAHLLLITIGFGALFIATLAAQIGRNQYQISSLDGPLRIFLGFFVFILLQQVKLNLIYLLSLLIPMSLIFLLIDLAYFDKAFLTNWGGRYASYFVDPNTLGGQCGIFSALTFYFLISQFRKNIFFDLIRLIGFFSGIVITFYAQSRGGWLALISMFIFILLIERLSFFKRIKERNLYFYLLIFIILLFCSLFFTINKTYLLNRTDSVFFEINLWLQNTSNFHEGAIYSRLGMWEVGFLLANESLFFGFGEKYLGISVAKFYDYLPLKLHHPLNILIGTGPHSDFLAKLLASGIIGAFAYVITILIPLLFFFKFIHHTSQSLRVSARLGTAYLIGIVITGLFNETLSLKYLCSFYGFILAIFLASIFINEPVNPYESK